MMMAAMGLGWHYHFVSYTKYRDFTILIGFAVQLLMYATPVAYPLSFLTINLMLRGYDGIRLHQLWKLSGLHYFKKEALVWKAYYLVSHL